MSQETLALHLGMTPGGVQKWLAGARHPTLEDIDRIAAILGVPGAQLTHGVSSADTITDLPDPARRVLRMLVSLQRDGGLSDALWSTIEQVVGLANAAMQAKPALQAGAANGTTG